MAWPSASVRASWQVGDQFTFQPVAKATTVSDGTYAIRVEDPSSLAPYADPRNSIVDFDLLVGDQSETTPFSFSERLNTSSTASTSFASASSTESVAKESNFVVGDATQVPQSGAGDPDDLAWGSFGPEADEPTAPLVDNSTPTPTSSNPKGGHTATTPIALRPRVVQRRHRCAVDSRGSSHDSVLTR